MEEFGGIANFVFACRKKKWSVECFPTGVIVGYVCLIIYYFNNVITMRRRGRSSNISINSDGSNEL